MSIAESIRTGVLELHPKGYGFLRDPKRNYKAGTDDVYVGTPLLARFGLRPGVRLSGRIEPTHPGNGPRLAELTEIEGRDPESYVGQREFENLTAVDPHDRIRLETGPEPLAGCGVMDLLTPVGKGQRGLIVAPPRSGKTILLQQIAAAVARNHPEIYLVVLLVDERPEEVTEMKRSIQGEVIASSNDHAPEEHIRLAQLTVERAKRVAESGGQVLILLDSLTRLARAYNKGSNSGRTMSGGVDIKALDVPKRLFGSARVFDEGGSLTILATCLIETGEPDGRRHLPGVQGDRQHGSRPQPPPGRAPGLAGDRHQRLGDPQRKSALLDPETLRRVTMLRRTLADMKPVEAMEALTRQLVKFPSNADFLDRIGQAAR